LSFFKKGERRDVMETDFDRKVLNFRKRWCKLVLEQFMESIMVLDKRFNIVWVNKTFSERVNLPKTELIGRKCYKILHLSDRPHKKCPYIQLLRDHKFHQAALNLKALGGRSLISVAPIKMDNELIGALCIIRYTDVEESLQEQLRERTRLLRAITEASKDAIVMIDSTGAVVFWNPAAETLFGYTQAEVFGRRLDELIMPPKYRKRFRKELRKLKLTGKTDILMGKTIEIEALKKNGEIIVVEISTSAVRVLSQWYAVGVIRDVTERKLMEEQLRNSERKYRYLFENSQAMNVIISPEGRILDINEAMARTLGYSKDELVGKRALSLIAPEDRRKIWENIIKFREQPPGWTPPTEVTVLGKTGKRTFLFAAGYAEFFEDGKFAGVLLTAIDITERKLAEQQLRESEEKFRTLAEMAASAIFIYREKFLYVNRATEEITGYSKDELYRMHVWDIVHPSQREMFKQRVLGRLSGENVPNRYEVKILRKDNKIRWIDFIGGVIHYEGGLACIGTALDITERKEMMEKLRASEAKYRSIFLNSKDLIFIANEKGYLTEINPAGLNLIGYTAEETRNMRIEDLILGEQKRQEYRTLMKNFGYVKDFVFRLNTKLRREVVALMTSVALMDADGNILGYNGIVRDVTQQRLYEQQLEESVRQQKRLIGEIIHAMSRIVEVRDPYTSGHQRRVAELAVAIANEMGLSDDRIEAIRVAGLLHDIGKIVIPLEILNKAGQLNDLEFEFIKTHPKVGYDLLKDIEFPWPVAEIVLQHHERLDGSGYPNGLKDGEIMLEARILAVADVVEAMSSHRPYRPALGIERALAEIETNRGTKYDPDVVDACLKLFREGKFKFQESNGSFN